MGAQFTIPLIIVIPGQLIASSLWNSEWANLSTNFIPAGMDSYSDTDSQMQIQTNPFPGGVTSHASSLGGEIERLRFQLNAIIGGTFWYQTPAGTLATMAPLISQLPITYLPFAGGNMVGPINMQGNRVENVSASAITGDALPAGLGAVRGSTGNAGTQRDIQQGTISDVDIRPNAVTPATLGAIVTGSEALTGGNGAPIGLNVDNVTIDVNGSNQLEVKAGSIGTTQVSSQIGRNVTTPHGQTISGTPTQTITITGPGRIVFVKFTATGSSNTNPCSIVLDGVTKFLATLSGTNPSAYASMEGILDSSGSFQPYVLDFVSSAVIQQSGANTKTIQASWATL